ncbi:Nucleotide-diphospho-sugar transferase family protein [Gossypium australe]|uniref:Nucleotide-diphospho-sugar transferase family protein n=1 Tax=Gossypium australe TaxID=47621 RepID=A0A5B6V0X2_9ROSI|nr:Nucleotide-diphospho-sugar transferase family protein [Gossypium australe]
MEKCEERRRYPCTFSGGMSPEISKHICRAALVLTVLTLSAFLLYTATDSDRLSSGSFSFLLLRYHFPFLPQLLLFLESNAGA